MRRAAALAALVLCGTTAANAASVLLISIDGLRPLDVIEARERGIDLPNLSRFLIDGSFAHGVTGILPTFTLPSHATLVTGVSPATHGITNNLELWPRDQTAAQSYTFATDIKVETLWDAAHRRGIGTASVSWPVSLGSPSIDHAFSVWSYPGSGQPDDAKYLRQINGWAFVSELESAIGPVHLAHRETATEEGEDERIASYLIRHYRPGFTTVHFGALDEAEHKFGPGSPQARAALETIDGLIGQLIASQRAVAPDATIAVVSDHGFTPVRTEINLPRAFLDAGLMTVDAGGAVTGWDAVVWPAGGSAAIILARPDDPALVARVQLLLDKLKARPELGIERVVGRDEIAKSGGFPKASFVVFYNLDTTGAVRPLSQALVAPAKQKGTHGHAASHPELRSSFFIAGPHIAKGHDLGIIDIRSIAPTLANILGVELPQAEAKALRLAE